MANFSQELGSGYEVMLSTATTQAEIAFELHVVADKLYATLDAEVAAFNALAVVLEENVSPLLFPPPWMFDNGEVVDEQSGGDARVTSDENGKLVRACAGVAEFATVSATQLTNITIPVASMIRAKASLFDLHAQSQLYYLRRGVATCKLVKDVEDALRRSVPMSATAKEAYARQRHALRVMRCESPDQVSTSRAKIHDSIQQLCVYVASTTHHLADPFEARHFGESEGNCHPVLALFEDDSPETVQSADF